MYADANYIESYAKEFGLDPDYVYLNKGFDDVMMWVVKWKREAEVEQRMNEIERMMIESGKK